MHDGEHGTDRKKCLATAAKIFLFASTKIQSAWSSVKLKLRKQHSARCSSSWSSKFTSQEQACWPEDEEDSQFCETLLGLMRMCGRFDYLGHDTPQSSSQGSMKTEKVDADKSSSLGAA